MLKSFVLKRLKDFIFLAIKTECFSCNFAQSSIVSFISSRSDDKSGDDGVVLSGRRVITASLKCKLS